MVRLTASQSSLLTGLSVFLFTLGIGLAINGLYGERQLVGDEPQYHFLAGRFAETGQYGDSEMLAFRSPLYPLMLGGIYRLFGKNVWVARLTQIVLGALMALLAYTIACHLGQKKAGFLAVLLVMLDSYWWLNQVSLMQENLTSVMVCASLLSALLGLHAGSPRWRYGGMAIAGFFYGASLLAKPLLCPLLLLIWLVPIVAPQKIAALRLTIVFFVTSVVTISPWVMFNYGVFGRFVPFTTGSGLAFYGAHRREIFEGAKGAWSNIPLPLTTEQLQRLQELPDPARELLLDQYHWEAGTQELRRHSVGQWALMIAFKWSRFWSPSIYIPADSWPILLGKASLIFINATILLFFLISLFEKSLHPWLPVLVLLAAMITVTILYGTIRFRYPLNPIIYAYSAAYLVNLRVTAIKCL